MGLSNYLPSSRISQSGVCTSSTRPASPYEGQVIYETDTDRVLVWNASAWVAPNSTTANPPGLELVKTQTVGAGVSSVTVTDAFSANYDNYQVVLNGIVPSAEDSFRVRFGSATTGYYGSMYCDSFGGGATLTLRQNNGNANYLALNQVSTQSASMVFDVTTPFINTFTNHYGFYFGRGFAGWSSGQLASGSHSSITILTDGAGTMTGGTIRVYGYRN